MNDNKRTKATTKGSVKDEGQVMIGGEWKFNKNPAYLKFRTEVWDELFAK